MYIMSYKENLKRATELKKELDSFRPLSAEVEKRIMQKFRLDWNYHSSHIEGNQLTYGETKALLLFGHTAQAKPLKDHIEMTGHNEAVLYIEEIIKQERPLTENFIRELHKLILKEPYEVNAITPDGKPTKRTISIGQYKKVPNHVLTKTDEMFYFATPEETPAKMNDLLNWYKENVNKKGVHPVLFASEFHYKFIRIHPFDDGNGRIARLLMNFLLMQKGYPPAIIKTENKNEYFNALQQADAGKLDYFFNYLCEQVIHSLELMVKGAKGEDIEEPDDLDKKIALLKNEIADVDIENEVQIQFNKDTFLNIYDTWLSELLKELVVKIKKFDDLFVKPTHYINIQTNLHEGFGGQSVSVDFINKNEKQIVDDLRTELLTKNNFIHPDTKVSVHASYGTFKKGALINPFGCNYNVEVLFDYLKYEIYSRRFIAGLKYNIMLRDDLKDTLKSQKNIKIVYFDENGNHYFNVHKMDDGTLFSKIAEDKNAIMVLSYSREDILNGKVIDGGMERFVEPRLLHKPLSISEIKSLSGLFGDTIYNHIDYSTKTIGIRKNNDK
jgi:Fic family protein